jgi:NADH:ubiquinone oxidoreductase subunit 6 (subunit J)
MDDKQMTRAEKRAKFWAETKVDIKWATPLLFALVMIAPIVLPPLLRLVGFGMPDGGFGGWYNPTNGEEDLPAITDAIFGTGTGPRAPNLVVPFEVLSVLLLAALIAGVVIAFRDPEGEA